MKRKDFLSVSIVLLLSFLFFILRVYDLKSLPIFVDEAIYTHWAQLGLYDASLRLVSLIDGKQPLFNWLTTALMNLIPNPLIAGRLISIGAGFFTMIGLFSLCISLFKNRWVGIISVSLYVFYPFALVLNRMAIYESLIGMFTIWSLYAVIMLVRYISLGTSLVLGLVLGGSILTKSSGFTNIYLLPSALILFKFNRKNIKKLFILLFYICVALLIAFLCYSILLLSDKFSAIADKNAIFIYHFRELIPYRAFDKWLENIFQLLNWTVIYLTYPVVFVIIFSFFKKSYVKEKFLLFLWFIIPLIGIALFGRSLVPRYLFSMTLLLVPVIAIGLWELYFALKNKIAYSLVVALIVGFLSFSNYKILTDMPHAPIPKEDLNQYVNSYSSGEGLKEIVAYLQELTRKEKILIASEGTYGSLPGTVIEIYFMHNTQVERYKFDTLPKKLPKELYKKAKSMPVYIIFNETQSVKNWPLEFVMRFKRGSGGLFLSLYKIK